MGVSSMCWETHTPHTPAVDHHGSGIWGVAGLDAAQEGQEGGGVLGHAMVRPGRELELADLPLLVGAALEREVTDHSVRIVLGLH